MAPHWFFGCLFSRQVAARRCSVAVRTPIELLTQLAPLLMPGCKVSTPLDLERLQVEQLENLHERLLEDLAATSQSDIRRDLLTALYPILVNRRVEAAATAVREQLARERSTPSKPDQFGPIAPST